MAMNINRKKFIEEYIHIKTKTNEIVKLKLNQGQNKLYDLIKREAEKNKPIRIIILKARQLGFSTLVESLNYVNTTTKFNVNSGIITHSDDATNNLYNMTKLMYEMMPEGFKPETRYSNAKELVFDNDKGTGLKSSIRCMTAGAKGVGRSATYTNLHISELAFWPKNKKEILDGLLQTVPDVPGTMIIIESTPNGYEYFKDFWDAAVKGENDFIPLFVGWNEMESYRMHYDGFELTEEEKELKRIYNLDLEQLAWRRHTIKNKCGNSIDTFHQEYPICPEEAFLSTGACIFNKDKVNLRIQQVREPKKKGSFIYKYENEKIVSFQWKDDPNGFIKIYEDREDGYPYVLSGDTAGIGSDNYCGDVINNVTGNQCAVLDILNDEVEYTRQMYCLGMYYYEALIGIESNYSTYPTKELYRLGYTNQYVRTIDNTIEVKLQDKLGWWTSVATRPVLLGYLVQFVEEEILKINDKETLKQMLYFVKKPNGKKEAEDGYHDDRVMSLGIAHQIRDQQRYTVEKREKETKIEWPDELKSAEDDYEYREDDYIGW